ncbi:TonB-dependent receptor plug domain-containing protein [Candidatus Methylacidiphilum infernorum]|uniref:TonB-dependent receptor plug domain-containing protein n=1 Tax=Candidatus Methylacidiphilum infernorum TaxID=511746 RepID=A0ABX7PXQ6_9BACT|nr:TonB-dependent receptor [Candidatus Methylacidiphilum infernorum]QSR87595.1 TonB-dependent receptor plug domain-containing protein [Candidatus Methylacidiphilum infernorum]
MFFRKEIWPSFSLFPLALFFFSPFVLLAQLSSEPSVPATQQQPQAEQPKATESSPSQEQEETQAPQEPSASPSPEQAPTGQAQPEGPSSPPAAITPPGPSAQLPPNIPVLLPIHVTAQEELPEEENVVETNMETNVLGTPMKVIDIPRTVQVVTRQELNTINAQTVNDLAAFTPGVNPTQMTGSPVAEPLIRGLPGTVYRNGMLVGFSQSAQWGPLMNMMAYDNLDVVTGPVSIVYGPQELAGGFANEVTKQPYFDKFRGNASYTLGMYDTNFWNIDIGGPILKDKLAYRFDYFGQDGYAPYNYYDGAYLQRQCFYLDLGAKPYENLSIDFNTELDINHFNTVAGINRVTSALINDGLYQTGTWIGWYGPPGVFHPGIGTAPPGAGYAVSWGPLVPISPRTNLFDNPENTTNQAYYVAQAIETLKVNDSLTVVNNSLFEYFSTFIDQAIPSTFWAILPNGYDFDDRLEFRASFDLYPQGKNSGQQNPLAGNNSVEPHGLEFHNLIDGGIEFRYFSDTEYSGVWHSPINIWNLTQPLGYNAFSPLISFAQATSPLFANPYLTDIPVPGYPGAFFNVFNYLSTADTFYELSPFYQHQINFTDKWSLMVGARMNSYFIQASPPQGTPAILSAAAPSFGLPPYTSTSMNIVQPEVTISPSYKPFPWMNTYFTFFYGQTTLLSQFGSFAPEFPSTYYHQNNFLYEVGTKFNLLHDKLFLGLSGYYQTGFIPAQVIPGGPVATTEVAIKGAQLMGNYQPNKNFWLNFGYAFIVGQELWQGLPIGPLAEQPYSSAVARQFGLPVDPVVNEPPLNYPFIGFPTNYGNLMATYKFDSGLGISLWALAESGNFIFYTYSTRIPSWYTLNARIFYTSKRWEASLYLYNITDEHYWLPGAPGFSNARFMNYDYIVPQLPFWIQGTLSIFF